MFQVLSNTQSHFDRPDLGTNCLQRLSARDFFLCSQGLKFGPIPNGILVTCFPNFEKKNNLRKKKVFINQK